MAERDIFACQMADDDTDSGNAAQSVKEDKSLHSPPECCPRLPKDQVRQSASPESFIAVAYEQIRSQAILAGFAPSIP